MGTANREASRNELRIMHRAHRASTERRKMGGSVGGVWGTTVVYRGGWPVDCASCLLYALIPYPRSTTNKETSTNSTKLRIDESSRASLTGLSVLLRNGFFFFFLVFMNL